MNIVNLVIPGLLWPVKVHSNILHDLHHPALATLLGRGRSSWSRAQQIEPWLAGCFGLTGENIPYAALRRAGEEVQYENASWMCADPVHLRLARDALILVDASELEITADETQRIIATLNEHFSALGEFVAPSAQRWYLRLHRQTAVSTHPVSAVIGRRIDAFLPSGETGAHWRRQINEAQMLLHEHPVNIQREAAGKPAINSVWFWGAGELPARLSAAQLSIDYSALSGDARLVGGLARQAKIHHAALPAAFQAGRPAPALFVLDQLQHAAQHLNAAAWCAALSQLETHWFAPALAALKDGAMDVLRLTALGDQATLDVTITRGDSRKFWRRSCSLSQLTPPASFV